MPKLYLGNLPYTVTEQDIRDFFTPLQLKSVAICTDRETKQPRGFGFVEIADEKAAQDAIADLNGCELGGRTLVVNVAVDKPRGERPSGNGNRRSAGPPPPRGDKPKFDNDKTKKRGGGGGRRREWND